MKAHEIAQIYAIDLDNKLYKMDGDLMTGDLFPSKLRWVDINEFKNGRRNLFPSELIKWL